VLKTGIRRWAVGGNSRPIPRNIHGRRAQVSNKLAESLQYWNLAFSNIEKGPHGTLSFPDDNFLSDVIPVVV